MALPRLARGSSLSSLASRCPFWEASFPGQFYLSGGSNPHPPGNLPICPVIPRAFSSVSSQAEPGVSPDATKYSSCKLESRGVISVEGPDTFHFLQALLTNDLSVFNRPPTPIPLASPNSPSALHPPLYSAILSPQGRMLYDLFIYNPSERSTRLDRTGASPEAASTDVGGLLVEADAEKTEELMQLLKRYRLRAKVDFENVSSALAVWARFADVPEAPLGQNGGTDRESAAGAVGWEKGADAGGQAGAMADEQGWCWHSDPRLSSLGLRGLFPSASTPPLVEADSLTMEEQYRVLRYRLGVAEGSAEIVPGDALPLEYNLDGLNGVSYTKGCYVGQELTARTHHRGVIRKRVMPVSFVCHPPKGDTPGTPDGRDPVVVPPGSDIVDLKTSKSVGKVVASEGPWGLAHLRLVSALTAATQRGQEGADSGEGFLGVAGTECPQGPVSVVPYRPCWWPGSWGAEE